MPENTIVGGVAFELNLNEGHFDNDVRQAGQRARSRLTKDFQATGKGIENSFKTSFSMSEVCSSIFWICLAFTTISLLIFAKSLSI